MDRRTVWIMRNGPLAVALYFAMVEHVCWLMHAISAFAWWSLAIAAWAMSAPSPLAAKPRAEAPPASTMAFDLAVLGAMFVGHLYWTAFAYALSCGCVALLASRAPSKL